jgi:hypothetical protein
MKIAGPDERAGRTEPTTDVAGAGAASARRHPAPRTTGTATPPAGGGLAVYVIAGKGSDELASPVFHAGDAGEEEVIAVFTSRRGAQQYIDRAGWGQSDEVGELPPPDFLRWLLLAADQGVHWLVVDPDRDRHLAGEPQAVIGIAEELAEFARSLTQDVGRSA